jgi:hypothetical protein
MDGPHSYAHSEEHQKSLILFCYTFVHPWAVMIHFPNASFANTTVVGALRLDAAALGALVDHLARLHLQALHVLFRSVPFRTTPGSVSVQQQPSASTAKQLKMT